MNNKDKKVKKYNKFIDRKKIYQLSKQNTKYQKNNIINIKLYNEYNQNQN